MMDAEGEAAWLLGDLDGAPSARRIVERNMGPGSFYMWPGALRGADAMLVTVGDKKRIAIRRGLGAAYLRWPVLHELAEWHIDRIGYREADVEEQAERLTAALVIPRAVYREAVRAHGERFAALARDFAVSQTCAALRFGETTGRPVAVIAPATVRVRGDDYAWPPADGLRKAAASRKRLPGLRKARLTDDRRRLVLVG